MDPCWPRIPSIIIILLAHKIILSRNPICNITPTQLTWTRNKLPASSRDLILLISSLNICNPVYQHNKYLQKIWFIVSYWLIIKITFKHIFFRHLLQGIWFFVNYFLIIKTKLSSPQHIFPFWWWQIHVQFNLISKHNHV